METSPGVPYFEERHKASVIIAIVVLALASLIAPFYIIFKYRQFVKSADSDSAAMNARVERITKKNVLHGISIAPLKKAPGKPAGESVLTSLLPLASALITFGDVGDLAGEAPPPEDEEEQETRGHAYGAGAAAATRARKMTWAPPPSQVQAAALIEKDLQALHRSENVLDHSKRTEMGQ